MRCGDALYDTLAIFWDARSQRHTVPDLQNGKLMPCNPETCAGCLSAAAGLVIQAEQERRNKVAEQRARLKGERILQNYETQRQQNAVRALIFALWKRRSELPLELYEVSMIRVNASGASYTTPGHMVFNGFKIQVCSSRRYHVTLQLPNGDIVEATKSGFWDAAWTKAVDQMRKTLQNLELRDAEKADRKAREREAAIEAWKLAHDRSL